MNMENLKLSKATIKKVKTILTPVFKEALNDEVIRKNVLEQVSMGGNTVKPALTDRLNEPLIDAIRKIYKCALKQQDDYTAGFLPRPDSSDKFSICSSLNLSNHL
ncbi:MAG: hypothetical protein U5K55_02995 [Aliarcobacter sp.]|nr:hypothetical protein [Aliarcobacter sp.]